MLAPSVLAKKTKQEIMAEYERLASQLENAKMLAQTSFSPSNLELVAKAKNLSLEFVSQSTAALQQEVAAQLNQFNGKLNELIGNLSTRMEEELKKFVELQEAVEASKLILEDQYRIQICAEAVNILIADFEDKKGLLAKENAQAKISLEEEIARQRAAWEREKEACEYDRQTAVERERQKIAEETADRGKVWSEREKAIKAAEDEIKSFREQQAKFGDLVANEIAIKEKALVKSSAEEYDYKWRLAENEWLNKENIYKLRLENLEAALKKQDSEMFLLKKEQEAANKKAQELAVKVIESSVAKSSAEESPDRNN